MKQKGLSNRMLLYLLLLLIPAMMIGCGLRWRRKPPKYPKHQDTVFGGIFFIDYRTENIRTSGTTVRREYQS